ncbi:MAG: ribonuclease HIII [Verrucomicrobiota bacterium]|nr:ribonuclease HIII [Limisphaera sp.]MDW8382911.1 ribonuclease HIII [Verrucomicrobiota bacterium]
MDRTLSHYTVELNEAQAEALEQYCRAHGFEFREVPHARFGAFGQQVNVICYQSGKTVIQGKGTRDFVQFVLEPEILKEARLGYELDLQPELKLPRVGIDESGKGDLFGPLCVAAVYVNESIVRAWQQSFIRDSKRVGSEAALRELARQIRNTPGCVHTVVVIGNAAYNRCWQKMGNVNRLLAWSHARALENLLNRDRELQPPPVRVISDQFAADPRLVARALMKRGRQLELIQRHRAEADPAVAAASILAREAFLDRLAQLSRRWNVLLPRGSGVQARDALKTLIKRHGPAVCTEVTKIHFRTVADVLNELGLSCAEVWSPASPVRGEGDDS